MMPTRTPYLSGRAPSRRCSVSVTNMITPIAYDSHVSRSSTSPNTWPASTRPWDSFQACNTPKTDGATSAPATMSPPTHSTSATT